MRCFQFPNEYPITLDFARPTRQASRRRIVPFTIRFLFRLNWPGIRLQEMSQGCSVSPERQIRKTDGCVTESRKRIAGELPSSVQSEVQAMGIAGSQILRL